MDRARGVLLVLVAVLLVLAAAMVRPFLDYVLLAVLLAFVLRPVQWRLRGLIGERLAASAIVLAAAVTIVVPAVLVVRQAVMEAERLAADLQAGQIGLDAIETSIQDLTGIDVDLGTLLRTVIEDLGVDAVGDVLAVVWTLGHVLLGIGLTLFLLYYFLKDGDEFLAWLERRVGLSEPVWASLLDELRNITHAVLAGHVLVAVVQGVVAGVGLWVVGVPNAALWTVVMVVLAVIPIVGSFLVWGPAVGWLLVVDRPIAAVALLVYGTIVVGLTDDYLRPIVVDRYAHVNPAVVILGIFGGITVIGFTGIFVGPILLGMLRATIDVYDREARNGAA